jgi:hypothetical protein
MVREGVTVGVLEGVKVGKRVGMIGVAVSVIWGVSVAVSVKGIRGVGVGWLRRLIDTKV